MPDVKKKKEVEEKSVAAARPSSHAIWSGTLSFGLVNIPVELHSAARGRQTSMRMVDADGNPLGRQYVSSSDGGELEGSEIVRAHELGEGEMVMVSDEELEEIAPDKSRDIDLRRFVPLEQIPPMHFERPYFMLPASESTKAYHLLAQTLAETGQAGIGTFVMRGHEYLVAILGDGGILRAETLRHADELRSAEDVGLPAIAKAPAKRVKALGDAIDALTESSLAVEELRDDYAESLRALAEAKAERGEGVVEIADGDEESEPEEEGGRVLDLMKLLKERLSAKAEVSTADEDGAAPKKRSEGGAKSGGAKNGDGKNGGAKGDDAQDASLSGLSKDALYEKAQALDIAGRSKMAKADLVKAIRAAS